MTPSPFPGTKGAAEPSPFALHRGDGPFGTGRRFRHEPRGRPPIRDEWIRDLLQLKRIPRAGWFRVGVERPESVADHSFAMALLAWQLARDIPGIDERRVVLLVLLHDFHEARLTDIPNPAKAYLPEGAVREAEHAVQREQWGDDRESIELVREFESGDTEEAKLARAVDHLEFLHQAAIYRAAGHSRAENMLRRAPSGAAWAHPVTRPLAEAVLAKAGISVDDPPAG